MISALFYFSYHTTRGYDHGISPQALRPSGSCPGASFFRYYEILHFGVLLCFSCGTSLYRCDRQSVRLGPLKDIAIVIAERGGLCTFFFWSDSIVQTQDLYRYFHNNLSHLGASSLPQS